MLLNLQELAYKPGCITSGCPEPSLMVRCGLGTHKLIARIHGVTMLSIFCCMQDAGGKPAKQPKSTAGDDEQGRDEANGSGSDDEEPGTSGKAKDAAMQLEAAHFFCSACMHPCFSQQGPHVCPCGSIQACKCMYHAARP